MCGGQQTTSGVVLRNLPAVREPLVHQKARLSGLQAFRDLSLSPPSILLLLGLQGHPTAPSFFGVGSGD